MLTIERDGRRIDLTAEDLYDEEAGYNVLGVTIGATRKTYGLFESIGESFFYLWSMVRETFTFFGSLFRGQVQSTDVAARSAPSCTSARPCATAWRRRCAS